ncbi:MAG TPA: FtsX-like permease family protein [Gaiellaceae bacterium]|nr:FtsX-like permease family protein [Gaiellaceae bacterium]
MIRVALRGLAGRKLRAALTAFAIVLGVAMTSGTLVLTNAIDGAFKNIFTEQYEGTDAVISGKQAITFEGEGSERPSVPASVLSEVRQQPSVTAATGLVVEPSAAKILDKQGKVIDTGGAPAFGFGVDFSQTRFNPLKLKSGRWPTSNEEVAIDSATADGQGFKVGDMVEIASLGPVQSFRLAGIATYGDQESLGTATFAVFTIPEAQRLFDRENQFDAIWVAAKPGIAPETLVDDLQPLLPANAEALTSKEQTREDLKSVSFTKYIRYFLLSFAGVALFVGAFVIFNTLSITVAQRIREFATLRTIGASRRQLLGSVALEALVIGVLASIVGLIGGLLLARGVNALFKATNSDLPATALNLTLSIVVYSLLLGTIVTLVAGLFPAVRATRVPPIAAVREGATLPPSRFAKYTIYVALVVVAIAVALLAYGMFGHGMTVLVRLGSLAIGCLLLFVGVALLSPRLVPWIALGVRPIAKWLMLGIGYLVYPTRLGAWIVRRGLFRPGLSFLARLGLFLGGLILLLVIGPGILALCSYFMKFLSPFLMYLGFAALAVTEIVLVVWVLALLLKALLGEGRPGDRPDVAFDPATDRLAGENSRRAPGRTAATAAALMIGLALVTFISVLANGMKGSNRDAIEKQVTAQYLVTSTDGFTPFSTSIGEAVANTPVVTSASSVREGLARLSGSSGDLTGIDPRTISDVYRFEWVDGSDETIRDLSGNGAIVEKQFAEDKNLHVDDTFKLFTSDGNEAQLTVRGIYKAPPFFPLLGKASILQSRFDELYERPENAYTFLDTTTESPSVEGSLEAAVADFPDAKVQSREDWIKAQDEEFDNFLILLYVLLALSVVVSVFGMVNTLVLSVFERTRELGMLRAVGMTRHQVSRMVRQESVITALIGAALGLPLGIFLAVLVTEALSQFDVQLKPPWHNLIAFAVVAMIVGVIAAVLPARRASRLNVLRALQYE